MGGCFAATFLLWMCLNTIEHFFHLMLNLQLRGSETSPLIFFFFSLSKKGLFSVFTKGDLESSLTLLGGCDFGNSKAYDLPSDRLLLHISTR